MDKVIQKQKGSGTSDQSLLRSRNKFRKILLFVIYYLTRFDDVQIYASQFMTSQIISLPFVLLNLEIVESKGKNYKSLNILRTKRAF